MSSSSLLDVTQHLVDQIKVLNERVTPQTAPPLLARVINKLDEKNGEPFNETEQQKLCNMLKLELKQLDDVLETCGYVFEQCAYFGASSEALSTDLAAAGLNGDLVNAFVAVWDSEGAVLRAKLAERSIWPKQLESSDWTMKMQLGDHDKTRIKKTVAVVSLTTRDQDEGGRLETHSYEFSREELVVFSKHLDRIQQQLDSLG